MRVTHFSSWFCFNFPGDLAHASLFYAYMRSKGIHMWEGRPSFVSTAHSDADLTRVVDAFAETLAEMEEAGFIPAPAVQPPMRGARVGRHPNGREAWFVPDPERPGKYLQVGEPL